MADPARQAGRRPLTNPEIALSAVLGIALPFAGLIVVALAIASTITHGQRKATAILGISFVWGCAVLALLLSQL